MHQFLCRTALNLQFVTPLSMTKLPLCSTVWYLLEEKQKSKSHNTQEPYRQNKRRNIQYKDYLRRFINSRDYSFDGQRQFLIRLIFAIHETYSLTPCVPPVIQELLNDEGVLKLHIVNVTIRLKIQMYQVTLKQILIIIDTQYQKFGKNQYPFQKSVSAVSESKMEYWYWWPMISIAVSVQLSSLSIITIILILEYKIYNKNPYQTHFRLRLSQSDHGSNNCIFLGCI